VNLHPGAATRSVAFAASGSQQAGYVTVDGITRASLWTGTASSWVDLNPVGATSSGVFAMTSSHEAGHAVVGGIDRPSLWTGTAASWVDLTPPGEPSGGTVRAASGSQQAGSVYVGGRSHASLWSGTAASWVDLHQFLPTEFLESIAFGMSTDGLNTYVSGQGYNIVTLRTEALLWIQPVPAPGAAGLLALGGGIALRRRRRG